MMKSKTIPNPVDVHVGSKIRSRRRALGISMETLGQQLGVTFQQIQKYERGANRVSASRLQNIASALGVPVRYFFEDMPSEQITSKATQTTAFDLPEFVQFVSSVEGQQLNRAFVKIEDPKVRKHIIALIKTVSAGEVTRRR
ncbi:helix-turn-helix domain-containing protein [Agrobacterium sp. 22-209-1]